MVVFPIDILLPFAVIIFILGAAYFCRKHLGHSNLNFVKEIISEFREIGNVKWTAKSINALAIIASIVIILIYFAASTLDKLVKLSSSIAGSPRDLFVQMISSVGVLGLLSILCVLVCSKET